MFLSRSSHVSVSDHASVEVLLQQLVQSLFHRMMHIVMCAFCLFEHIVSPFCSMPTLNDGPGSFVFYAGAWFQDWEGLISPVKTLGCALHAWRRLLMMPILDLWQIQLSILCYCGQKKDLEWVFSMIVSSCLRRLIQIMVLTVVWQTTVRLWTYGSHDFQRASGVRSCRRSSCRV